MLLLFRCDCEGACGGHGSLFEEVRVEDLPTPKTRGPQKCDECGKVCKSEYHLQKHKAMHKPILEVDLCCPKCGKGFENKHRRAGHIGKCKGKETETETEKRTETLQEETTSNNKKNKEPEKRTEVQQEQTTLNNKQNQESEKRTEKPLEKPPSNKRKNPETDKRTEIQPEKNNINQR